MPLICLSSAITLTEWSERTFWRKFADGSMVRKIVEGKAMIQFDLIKPYLCLPFGADDFPLLEKAEAGDAEAQNEIALLFLSYYKPKSAVFWLERAAKQGYADAMNLLSHCYMSGSGVSKDENIGIMWLANAAALGHVISQRMVQDFRNNRPKE